MDIFAYNPVVVDFLKELNREQLRAVQLDQGPVLILAGAGSGKTRVITYRIAYLIGCKGVVPESILAVTFTNKAAEEMKSRMGKLLGDKAAAVWIRTYHSTCAKILRGAAERAGLPRNFSIYDEHDQLALVELCLKELKIASGELKPNYILRMICRAKENLVRPGESSGDLGMSHHPMFKRVYALYDRKLADSGAVDFDDLILKAVELFKKDKTLLEKYQNRFEYIMVDEYQDTNHAQYVLTNLLAEKHHNLCVVGDDDQSIYSWRGAEIRNILDFEKDYPDAKIIRLEQNYRSTKRILKAASEVVRKNNRRKKKKLWCRGEQGERIERFHAADEGNEAAFVARKVRESMHRGCGPGEIAVFYRVNYQSRVFEEFFVRQQIPYEVVGGLKFFERPEVRNVVAFMRLANNSDDTVSLRRIMSLPGRDFPPMVLEKIGSLQKAHGIPLLEAMGKAASMQAIEEKTRKRVVACVQMIEALVAARQQASLYELAIRAAREAGYVETGSRHPSRTDFDRQKNVEELLKSIAEQSRANSNLTLEDYLESVTLRSDIDDWSNQDKVSLMTLHNAKGLEFETVFITGLEDGLVPHYKSEQEGRYEEERRLFYVGITRAKRRLFLTSAGQRPTYRGGFTMSKPSPFLEEIPKECMRDAT